MNRRSIELVFSRQSLPHQHLASHRGYKLGLTYTSEGSLLGRLAEKRVKRRLNFKRFGVIVCLDRIGVAYSDSFANLRRTDEGVAREDACPALVP